MSCCRLTIFLLIALLPSFSMGQGTTQWATEVFSYSSQFGNSDYSAKQALGVPNAMGGNKMNHLAWVPKKEGNSLGEYLEVGFAKPMRVSQVAIAESLNPGSIHRIYLIDTNGEKHKVYENKNPKNVLPPFRLFRHTFQKSSFLANRLRLELKTKSVAGSNQIDAIAISDTGVPIKINVESISYEEEQPVAERLSNNVNSEFAERLPIITPDGKTLYFARKYHPQNMGDKDYDDIWISNLGSDGQWGYATNPGPPLNNRENNFAIAFNPTGSLLYLANDYEKGAKDGVSISNRAGRGWTAPKTLKIKDHYNDSPFVSYHVNMEGNILLMAVERKEGMGDRDLYVSFRQDKNNWTIPKNLGPTINTVGMESSVFLAADGKTIYFSSNGHEGFGGLDMFISKRLDDSWANWTKPKNLGEGINTANNEYNYSISARGDYAYFAADDPSGMSDIFRVRLPKVLQPEPVVLYSGRIINSETNKRIDQAEIRIQSLKEDKPNASLVANGDYQFAIPFGEDMQIHAELDGYFALGQSLELSGDELEALDYDPASADNSTAIGDDELKDLRQRIDKLNSELERLEDQRLASQRNSERGGPNMTNRPNDAELEKLKEQFAGNKSTNRKPETKSNSGDKELDDLKNKFGKAFEEKEERTVSNEERAKNDKALEDLKSKYDSYFNRTESAIEEKETVADREAVRENFDFYKEKIREQLSAELLPGVIKDLEYRLVDETIKDVIDEVDTDEKAVAKDLQTKVLLKERLRSEPMSINYPKIPKVDFKDLDPQLEKALRSQIKEDVLIALDDYWKPIMQTHIRQEFLYLIKSEMEQNLAMQLQAEMEKRENFKPVEAIASRQIQTVPFKKAYREEQFDLLVVPLREGQTIPMDNIFFDANNASLKPISTVELERVLRFLNQYPAMIVEIGGHTNGWCSHEFANQLSTDRTKTVADFFINEGIEAVRIKTRGYGKTQPIATNDTAEGRKKNQRVELKILSMGD